MQDRIQAYIRRQELMRAGDRVGLAVSGGADSVALLQIMLELRAELGVVPAVVHCNHRIRGADADADQRFVAGLAAEHGLEFHVEFFDTPDYARRHGLSLEAAGRALRYQYFAKLLAGTLTSIATAHTMDDQAETVLLRLMRGAGTRGLAGIFPKFPASSFQFPEEQWPVGSGQWKEESPVAGRQSPEKKGVIVRPLLAVRRAELRSYLRELKQDWREDASNLDVKHTRNRVRQELLPLMEREFNPAVVEVLAELAEVARGEEEYWGQEIRRLCAGEDARVTAGESTPERAKPARSGDPGETPALPGLDRAFLLGQPLAVQRRMVRGLAEDAGLRLEFRHVERVLEAGRQVSPLGRKRVELPEGWVLTCTGQAVSLKKKQVPRGLKPPRNDKNEVSSARLKPSPSEESASTAADEASTSPSEGPVPTVGETGANVTKVVPLRGPLPGREPRQGGGGQIEEGQGGYEYRLPIPGEVKIGALGKLLKARRVRSGAASSGYNNSQLLDPDRLAPELVVRNWRPGDRFWPAHSKSPRKLKELLLRRRLPPGERAFWPVVLSGETIVWVPGWEGATAFLAGPEAAEVVVIEEVNVDADRTGP